MATAALQRSGNRSYTGTGKAQSRRSIPFYFSRGPRWAGTTSTAWTTLRRWSHGFYGLRDAIPRLLQSRIRPSCTGRYLEFPPSTKPLVKVASKPWRPGPVNTSPRPAIGRFRQDPEQKSCSAPSRIGGGDGYSYRLQTPETSWGSGNDAMAQNSRKR